MLEQAFVRCVLCSSGSSVAVCSSRQLQVVGVVQACIRSASGGCPVGNMLCRCNASLLVSNACGKFLFGSCLFS
jgi:hypothetical protein